MAVKAGHGAGAARRGGGVGGRAGQGERHAAGAHFRPRRKFLQYFQQVSSTRCVSGRHASASGSGPSARGGGGGCRPDE